MLKNEKKKSAEKSYKCVKSINATHLPIRASDDCWLWLLYRVPSLNITPTRRPAVMQHGIDK